MGAWDYDVAQVCLNGHVVNERSKKFPKHNTDYCADCGAKTTTTCHECDGKIRGAFDSPVINPPPIITPSYCTKCGKPYPWMQDKIDAFRKLVDLSPLDEGDKKVLSNGVEHIISDTPKTKLTCARFVRIISKESPLGSALLNVAAEHAKEILDKLWTGMPLT